MTAALPDISFKKSAKFFKNVLFVLVQSAFQKQCIGFSMLNHKTKSSIVSDLLFFTKLFVIEKDIERLFLQHSRDVRDHPLNEE